jgi:outer membrane protein W
MRQINSEPRVERRRLRRVAVALVSWIAFIGASQGGEPPESRWVLRGGALGLISTGDEAGVLQPLELDRADTQKSVSGGIGIGLELEYRVQRRIGVEFTTLLGDIESDLVLETGELPLADSQDIGFTAVTLGVNYHFIPDARADLYVSLFLESSEYDDVTYQFPAAGRSVTRLLDDDPGFGMKVGVDVPLKRDHPWTFAGGVRHLRGPLDIKPVIISAGIGYRF